MVLDPSCLTFWIRIWSSLCSCCICTCWWLLPLHNFAKISTFIRHILCSIYHIFINFIIFFFLDICRLLWSLLIHVELLLQLVIPNHHELFRGTTTLLKIVLIELIDLCIGVKLFPPLWSVLFLYHCWRIVAYFLQHLNLFFAIKFPLKHIIMASFLL